MPVGAYLDLVSRMSDTEFVDAADIIVGLRMVKSDEELAYVKRATEVTGLARQRLFGQVVPGMTEREVARLMRQLILEEGGDRTSFVILQLEVAGSKNQFHYDRPLQAGTILAVDAGAYVGMYTVDYVRMASLGPATDSIWKSYRDIDRSSRGAFPYSKMVPEGEDPFEFIARKAMRSGIGRTGKVGLAHCHLFPAGALVDFAVEWMQTQFA